MDLNDLTITDKGTHTSPKLLPPAPVDAEVGWRGKVIYLYDVKTGTTIRKVFGQGSHLGAVED